MVDHNKDPLPGSTLAWSVLAGGESQEREQHHELPHDLGVLSIDTEEIKEMMRRPTEREGDS